MVSYVAMEFWSPVENMYLVAGVCIESASESGVSSYWFVCKDIRLENINFCKLEGKNLYISPVRQLMLKGRKLKSSELMGRDKGTEQLLRALGLRCDVKKYRAKLLKMMAFNPENNIDQFIQDCVLEPGRVDSLKEVREQKELSERLAAAAEQLAALEASRLLEPPDITAAKALIAGELGKRGVRTEVRTFAELVQDIQDEDWRPAIETFLGRRRHHIIVDGKYCHQALEILHENKIRTATVVLTDKLPETGVISGSAAEQLVIPNVYGRRYANYLLNGIALCRDLRELHDHPKGGLMQDGTLAKSYAVSLMDMAKTSMCLGEKAVQLQKEEILRIQRELNKQLPAVKKKWQAVRTRLEQLEEVIWRTDAYQFAAPRQLADQQMERQETEQAIERVKSNPDFATALEEQQRARAYYNEVMGRATSWQNTRHTAGPWRKPTGKKRKPCWQRACMQTKWPLCWNRTARLNRKLSAGCLKAGGTRGKYIVNKKNI